MTIKTTNDPGVLIWVETGQVITRYRHPELFLAVLMASNKVRIASSTGERSNG